MAKATNWPELKEVMLTASTIIPIWAKTNKQENLEKVTALAKGFMDSLYVVLKEQKFEDLEVDIFNALSTELSFSKYRNELNVVGNVVSKLDNQSLSQLDIVTEQAKNFVSYILAETETASDIDISLKDVLTKLVNFYNLKTDDPFFDSDKALDIIDKQLTKALEILYQHPELLVEKATDFISNLVVATKGLPLKIISVSCFGANLQDCLHLLPKGSILITLSDRDVFTQMRDFFHDKIQSMLDEVAASNGLKLEDLVKIYCMTQRFAQSDPIVGSVNKDGVTKTISLSMFAERFIEEYAKTKSLSPVVDVVLESLIEKIKSGVTVESFKIPAVLLSLDTIIKHISNNTLPDLKAEWQNYYELGALDNLVIDPGIDQHNEARHINKLNIKQKLEAKLLGLQKLTNVFQANAIDPQINSTLQVMLDSQLTIEERTLAEGKYQLLIKQSSVSHKLHDIEYSIAEGILWYNDLPAVRYIEDNNVRPYYNQLLVLGAEYFVQHIGDIIDI